MSAIPGEAASLADLPLREELAGASPYGAPQIDAPVRLNTNENPYPPSEALVEELVAEVRAAAVGLNRYPDRGAVELRERLAAYVSGQVGVEVSTANLWAANGSNEVLHQLLQAFGGPGRTALGFTPSYSMHPILCQGTHTEFVSRERGSDFRIDPAGALAAVREIDPDVVFVTSPNNPTGDVTPLELIEELARQVKGLVVVDEAYMEFSDQPSAIGLVDRYPNRLVVSRTMSKAFDFAGGRLGYLVAAPAVVDALQLVRLPYHLSTLGQAAALVALRHADETLATVATLKKERGRVADGLAGLGFEVADSEANFVFFGRFSDSHAAWQVFLDRGVLIRDVGQRGYLRATIGTPEDNDALLDAARHVAARRGA